MLYSVKLTRIWRNGNQMFAEAHIQGPGEPIVVQASSPIPTAEQTIEFLRAARARVSGDMDIPLYFDTVPVRYSGTIIGCDEVGWNPFKSIKKAATSIAKSAVIRKLGNTVRDVVKSNVTATAVGALAVAFPPVGVPAAAAYATARATVELAEKGIKMAKDAKGVAQAVAKLPPAQKNQALQTIAASKQAQNVMANVVRGVVQKNPEAIKWAKAFVIAKQSKAKMEEIAREVAQRQQTKGVLVLPSGEILAGAFRASDVRRV